MGQRHQLFVIAKVNGKYRSLAVVHHQWLYGYTALRQCRKILEIFSNPNNATALSNELKYAAINQVLWDGVPDYQDCKPRFPFITTCLMLGASFSPEDSYFHQVSPEPFNLDFDAGDNNNGITIIDISDPNDIRYCFVDFFGMESNTEVQLMTPLTGRIYLEAYYDPQELENELMAQIMEDLDGWKIVTVEALEDTWPDSGWEV